LTVKSNKSITEDDIIYFFNLDEDVDKINGKISVNDFMEKAIELYSGIRVLRQDPVETIIEFVCAQNKNIPAIQNTITELSKKYGEKAEINGITFYGKPDIRKIARSKLGEILETGIGYRAKYLLSTAKKIAEDSAYIDKIRGMEYFSALNAMTSGKMKLYGVGLKVADCILLYGFYKLEAFPIDVWILRAYPYALKGFYDENLLSSNGSRKTKLDRKEYLLMGDVARKVFGKYAGYAQLYIYLASRSLFRESKKF
jgi:N-glycosylase/DNA lyase